MIACWVSLAGCSGELCVHHIPGCIAKGIGKGPTTGQGTDLRTSQADDCTYCVL